MADPKGSVPLCAQMEVRMVLNGQQIENVLHFSFADGSFEECVEVVSGLYVDDVWNNLTNTFGPQLTLNSLYWTDLDNPDGPVASYTTGLPLGGLGVIASLPNNVALVICKRTNKRGRANRGRIYVAGAIVDRVANSQFTNTYVTGVLAAYNTFREDVAAAGYPFVLASWAGREGPGFEGHTVPISVLENTTPATRSQRRRNPGVGT